LRFSPRTNHRLNSIKFYQGMYLFIPAHGRCATPHFFVVTKKFLLEHPLTEKSKATNSTIAVPHTTCSCNSRKKHRPIDNCRLELRNVIIKIRFIHHCLLPHILFVLSPDKKALKINFIPTISEFCPTYDHQP
jgi:hypothetical protein